MSKEDWIEELGPIIGEFDKLYKYYLDNWSFEIDPNDGSVYSVDPIVLELLNFFKIISIKKRNEKRRETS